MIGAVRCATGTVSAGVDTGPGTYRPFACKDDLARAVLAERAEITLAELAAGARPCGTPDVRRSATDLR
jgi:hypothetical protein